MGRTLNRQTTRTEIDTTTGELKRIITDEAVGYIDQEPDYIKIYIGTQLCLNNLDPALAPYILAFAPYMTYANDKHTVRTGRLEKEGVAKTLSVSVKRVEQIVKILSDNGIFIPIYHETESDGVVTRIRSRGVYFVNPYYAAKGAWKDVKELRQSIDFVRGTSSYVIGEVEGTRKIEATLPASYYQLSLDDYARSLPGEKGKN